MQEESLVAEYHEHLNAGAHFAALAKLGELIFRRDAQRSQPVDGPAKADIEPTLQVEQHVAEVALSESRDAFRRALRIVENGGKYEWEELVWVLTLRTQLRFVRLALAGIDIDCDDLDLSILDSELAEATASTANRRTLASAVATVAKNWELPVAEIWTLA